jgi:hypothetical protein
VEKIGRRYEEIEQRYPLLIAAMKWAAILSTTEAVDCIKAIQEERGSGEAVQHFGGPLAVFKGAMRCRKWAKQLRESRRAA